MAPSASTLHVAALHLSGRSQSSGSDASTSPTAVATLATDTFDGSIQQNGTGVHSFTVTSFWLHAAGGLHEHFTVDRCGIGPGDRFLGFVDVELQPEHQPERYGAERKYRVEWDAE
jgi:hypothetical protein